jgi:general stress protein 26
MINEVVKRAGEIVGQATAHNLPEGSEPYCVLALIDENGFPSASTITPSKADGINWITFCTGLGSDRTKRIDKCSRASVCYNTGGEYNITLVGTIEVVTDAAVKREMWYKGLENHFSGPDDPNYCVLRFHTQRYSLLVDWKEAKGVL